MRSFFSCLTVCLVLIGFVIPLAWAGAAVTGLLAIGSAPSGLRPDGKPRSGGLFGGMIDAGAINRTMMDCPYCGAKIMKDVAKCRHCGEWIKK